MLNILALIRINIWLVSKFTRIFNTTRTSLLFIDLWKAIPMGDQLIKWLDWEFSKLIQSQFFACTLRSCVDSDCFPLHSFVFHSCDHWSLFNWYNRQWLVYGVKLTFTLYKAHHYYRFHSLCFRVVKQQFINFWPTYRLSIKSTLLK